MPIPRIETERLVLRMYQPTELETVYRLLADKDVKRFYPPGFSVTREQIVDGFPRRMDGWRAQGFGQLGVFEKKTGEMLGYCGLQFFDATPEVEIYYGFFQKAWGKGIATEAAAAMLRFGFEETHLDKIVAGTHPDNFASQKVLEKIGLIKYPELKRFYNIDSVYFSILRQNFRPDPTAAYVLSWMEIDD